MKKPGKKDNEVSYWESMADGVIGLLLCILLILMLLILYLMLAREDDFIGDDYGNEEGGAGYSREWDYDQEGGGWENSGDEEGDDEEDGGGGGHPYDDPDPGEGEGDGSDKAAVLVQVVDGETQRTIKKQGIQFELYDAASALQVLSTYYPAKIDYRKYETDKEGTFYLPEKIRLGTYYLHDLTGIEGYDLAGNWEFAPDRDYDWDEPFLVSVEVFPSKNIIRLQLNDRDSGEPLTDAEFDIVAAEDITTQDGSVRFKAGEVADTVSVNEDGYAESKELYLGDYLIRQKTAPDFYSCLTEDTAVQVKKKSAESTPPLNELDEQKTTINISVVDALYTNQGIEGAVFNVTDASGNAVATLTSDSSGRVSLTDLRKGSTYHIKQTVSADNYKIDPNDHIFTVNSQGRINEKEVEELQIDNEIVRISISVRDRIFKSQLSDVSAVLVDQNGKAIDRWNTSAVDHVIEGLKPGEYRIILNGNESDPVPVQVEDVVDIQPVEILRWTMLDIAGAVTGGVVAIAAAVGVLFLLRRRKSKKNQE